MPTPAFLFPRPPFMLSTFAIFSTERDVTYIQHSLAKRDSWEDYSERMAGDWTLVLTQTSDLFHSHQHERQVVQWIQTCHIFSKLVTLFSHEDIPERCNFKQLCNLNKVSWFHLKAALNSQSFSPIFLHILYHIWSKFYSMIYPKRS